MKKLLTFALSTTVVAGLILLVSTSTSEARSKYKKEFYKMYVDDNADFKSTADNKASGRCWLCHVNMEKHDPPEKGLKKRVRNNYGVAMSEFIGENEKDKDKIREALEKVAKVKSDPSDSSSPTFEELIAEGKLPGNDVPNEDDLVSARKRRAEDEAKKAAKKAGK